VSNDSEDGELTSIEKPYILLVEGSDEKKFFRYFLKYLKTKEGSAWDNLDNLQVIDYGGSNFKNKLNYILTTMPGNECIQKAGIIHDADTDAGESFSMIKDVLSDSGFASPDEQFIFTTGIPKIIIMIAPENGSGSIELYFLESVKQDPAIPCVDKYFSCLDPIFKTGVLERPINLHKASLHAFLSSRKKPKASFGGGCQENYWTFSDPAFSRIKDFLRLLIN